MLLASSYHQKQSQFAYSPLSSSLVCSADIFFLAIASGGCFGRCKGLTGEDREKALAKAKKDFTVGAMKKITSIVVDKPKSAQSEHIAGEDIEHGTLVYASKGSPTESSGALITVVFDAEDVKLYDKLAAVSKKNRRSPDQQILWMIEEYLSL